jgi:hypothetical protein
MAIIQRERNQEARAFSGATAPSQGYQGKGKADQRGDRPPYKGKESKGKGIGKREGKKQEEQKK